MIKISNNLTVLLIEDNELLQKIYAIMLKNLGYNVHMAGNSEEAAIFFDKDIAAIITDIGLPGGKSGIDIAKDFRCFEKTNKTGRIPIIAITAYTDAEVHKKGMKAGINEIATKPVTQDHLKIMLKQWITWSQRKTKV